MKRILLLTLPRFDLTMLGVLLVVCGVTMPSQAPVEFGAFDQPKSRQFLAAIGISLNVLSAFFQGYRFFQDFIFNRSTLGLRGNIRVFDRDFLHCFHGDAFLS